MRRREGAYRGARSAMLGVRNIQARQYDGDSTARRAANKREVHIKLAFKGPEIIDKLQQVYGSEAIERTTVFKWLKESENAAGSTAGRALE